MTQPSNNSGLSLEEILRPPQFIKGLTYLGGCGVCGFDPPKAISAIEANYISRAEVAKALEEARLEGLLARPAIDAAWNDGQGMHTNYKDFALGKLKKKWGLK